MINFLNKILPLNTIYVIGIVKKDASEALYRVIEIKKYKNKIDIISSFAAKHFEAIFDNIDLKIPVILLVDGKGVLNKEINFKNEVDLEWQKNINYDTIFYTSFKSVESNFISFIRKSSVDEIVQKFKSKNAQIIDIYIGSFLSALLYDQIQKDLLSNDLILEFVNKNLTRFTKNPDLETVTYYIGNQKITNDFLPLYGTIIDFFVKPKEVSKTKSEYLNVEELIYKKAFKLFGCAMLVGFFASLLLSYILIQYYGSKNVSLNFQNVYTMQSYQKILDLEKEKDNKLKILKQSGWFSSKLISHYSYEIIKNIPNDLSLIELNIEPLENEIKANKKPKYALETIIIKGETINENSFNSWVSDIKKANWITTIEIISFKKDKNNKTQFEIQISLNNV